MLEQSLGLKKIEKILKRLSLEESLGVYHGGDREAFLRAQYLQRVGVPPDLKTPHAYNEKLQWLKLHWRDDAAPVCANKLTARDYVTQRGFGHLLHPLLAVWNTAEDIDFSGLPDAFIIKAAHASGFNLIVQDRHTLPLQRLRLAYATVLQIPYHAAKMEWVYEDGPACLICEELLVPDPGVPLDYKFFCFDGVVKAVEVLTVTDTSGTKDDPRSYFCDEMLRPLPASYGYLPQNGNPPEPACFGEMKAAAEALSAGFPHVRVDFCVSQGRPWFGEFTFFPGAGFDPFRPESFGLEMGSWLRLPPKTI